MIVDTNVLIEAIETSGPEHAAHVERLYALAEARALYANEIIFAELSGRFSSAAATVEALAGFRIRIERLSLDECYRAGQAFREYRRRQGQRTAILPDFLIGAQAALRGWPLLTYDRKGFESYFPEVELIDPLKATND